MSNRDYMELLAMFRLDAERANRRPSFRRSAPRR